MKLRRGRILALVVALATLSASLGLTAPARGAEPIRVAIIVGPVGEKLTPVYLALAEAAATAAEERGAAVARAYSPHASAEAVLDAVSGAGIVVYFGHGVGAPNPYSETPSPATTNGWGLNGPAARGDHADSWSDGTLAYYGEAWIVEHARPAPGWVMIYSNACYAPGAGEGFEQPASEETAAERVAAYSRAPLAELGASAYFATDFFEGAAHLVGALLEQPQLPYGELFASEPRFSPDGLVRLPHPEVSGAETWLHRSAYFEGKVDYWYAFAGDPSASLGGGVRLAAWQPGIAFSSSGVGTVLAMPYAESPGFAGQPTVALNAELRTLMPDGVTSVEVCAERCAELRVVDALPPQPSTSAPGGEAVIAISHHAWSLVTDRALDGQGLLVRLRVHPTPERPSSSATAALEPDPALPPPPSLPAAPPASSAPSPAATPPAPAAPAPTPSPPIPSQPLSPSPIPSPSLPASPTPIASTPTPAPSTRESAGPTASPSASAAPAP